MMYCAVDGRTVSVRNDEGRLIRKFTVGDQVIGAQVSGDNVSIQSADGWAYLYNISGRLVRKTKG